MSPRASPASRACLAAVLALAAAAGAAPASPARGFALQLLPGSRLMLAARVNGHDVQALLDSAAEATIIDRDCARRIGLLPGAAVQGQGSGAATFDAELVKGCLLYTSPSPRDRQKSRMPSSA